AETSSDSMRPWATVDVTYTTWSAPSRRWSATYRLAPTSRGGSSTRRTDVPSSDMGRTVSPLGVAARRHRAGDRCSDAPRGRADGSTGWLDGWVDGWVGCGATR